MGLDKNTKKIRRRLINLVLIASNRPVKQMIVQDKSSITKAQADISDMLACRRWCNKSNKECRVSALIIENLSFFWNNLI